MIQGEIYKRQSTRDERVRRLEFGHFHNFVGCWDSTRDRSQTNDIDIQAGIEHDCHGCSKVGVAWHANIYSSAGTLICINIVVDQLTGLRSDRLSGVDLDGDINHVRACEVDIEIIPERRSEIIDLNDVG